MDEGGEGILEDEARLDQVLSAEGDRLWYDDDFGGDWKHLLRVEKVLDSPPSIPVCVGGKLACPPEDCGGVWGYAELAAWVRSGYEDALRPDVAAELTEPFRVLLDVVGERMALTGAGYLKPAAVEQVARRTGITEWWIGTAHREDLTWPVAELCATA